MKIIKLERLKLWKDEELHVVRVTYRRFFLTFRKDAIRASTYQGNDWYWFNNGKHVGVIDSLLESFIKSNSQLFFFDQLGRVVKW